MTLTLFLLRHGNTVGTGGGEPARFLGCTDVTLDGPGRDQARRWREHLGVVPFARVLCSDLSRSLDTARIIAADEGPEPEPLAALREIDLGDWECRAMADVRRDFPDLFEARGRDMAGFRPPGGESFQDLSERVIPVIETLAKEVHGNVLLAGHAGVNRVILCHVLGLPLAGLFRLGQDHGCLNVISWGASGPVLRLLNLPPDGDLF